MKRFAVVQERKVGGCVLQIDGDGPVVAGRMSGVSHGVPSGQMSVQVMPHDEGKTEEFQGDHEGRRGCTT